MDSPLPLLLSDLRYFYIEPRGNYPQRGEARAGAGSQLFISAQHTLHIEVIDKGAGFAPDIHSARGFGLFSIRERLKQIGGR